MMERPITATIITLNEEKNIEAVIGSAKRVCDEIIVVDSESTDRTVELAEKAGAKVYVQKYLGDGPQKHFGVQFAKNQWIFSIDADERFDEDAVKELETLDLDNSPFDRYTIKRKTYVGEKWITIWYPDRTTRLYRKDRAGYQDSIGHASVVGGTLGNLSGHLLHYSYKSYADLVSRVPKFSIRGARQLVDRGRPLSPLSPLLHGTTRFVKHYLIKRGFLLGVDGLNIAVTSAYVVYMKYAMALEEQRRAKREGKF